MSEYKGRKDNEVYAELEKRYLETRDKNAFWAMYLLVQRFETRLIRKYCEDKRCVFGPDRDQHEQAVQDLANDMTIWMMNRYIKDPNFSVQKGMSAYAPFAFKKIMYAPNRMVEEIRKKALEDQEVQNDHIELIDDFETETEKKARWYREKVAPGVYQGILPLFDEDGE